jgi:hypothetical protein
VAMTRFEKLTAYVINLQFSYINKSLAPVIVYSKKLAMRILVTCIHVYIYLYACMYISYYVHTFLDKFAQPPQIARTRALDECLIGMGNGLSQTCTFCNV